MQELISEYVSEHMSVFVTKYANTLHGGICARRHVKTICQDKLQNPCQSENLSQDMCQDNRKIHVRIDVRIFHNTLWN